MNQTPYLQCIKIRKSIKRKPNTISYQAEKRPNSKSFFKSPVMDLKRSAIQNKSHHSGNKIEPIYPEFMSIFNRGLYVLI